jgi:hypothetical protein
MMTSKCVSRAGTPPEQTAGSSQLLASPSSTAENHIIVVYVSFISFSACIQWAYTSMTVRKKLNFVPLTNLFSRTSIFSGFEEKLQSVLQCQIMFDPKDQV